MCKTVHVTASLLKVALDEYISHAFQRRGWNSICVSLCLIDKDLFSC